MDGLSVSPREIPQIRVELASDSEQTSCSISRGNRISRSMENLLDIQSPTTTTLPLTADHRHCSVPEALDTLGKKPSIDHESLNLSEDEQRLLSAVSVRPASQKRKQQTLVLPSRKEMHYDYVRRSIIHQSLRLNNLKRQTKSTGDVSKVTTTLDEFDSDDGGYVIECQYEEEEPLSPTQIQEPGTSSSYVQLQSSPAGSTVGQESASEALTSSSQSSDEADSVDHEHELQLSPPCSPKPPLFLHEHPSLIGAEAADCPANDERDYEKIVIYEELAAPVPEGDSEHYYDTVLQMRGRSTQLVHGRHLRKLKKFIVKRKSNAQLLVAGNPDTKTQDSIGPGVAVEESDSDSNEEDNIDSKLFQQNKLQLPSRRSPEPGTLRRAQTYHLDHSNYRKERESKGDEILRKSQYDKMMEAMLNDREMRELQDAGAVKVKNLAEMRAEIEQLVRNAPSVPPPLPDHDRPKTPLNSKKKWSSKSLRY